MNDQASQEPTERFNLRAGHYVLGRPSYPEEAIDYIVKSTGLTKSSLVVDLGCGTGISSRLFAARGFRTLGIEPNAEMLAEARAQLTGYDNLSFESGTAEDTGLAGGTAHLVNCAQAFHWFRPEEAFREMYRILQPEGWIALVWNERDESFPFTKRYGDLLRTSPETGPVEMKRGAAGEQIFRSNFFGNCSKQYFSNWQSMDQNGLFSRAFSTSYAPKPGTEGGLIFEQELTSIFAEFNQGGQVTMHYQTSVYLGQAKSGI